MEAIALKTELKTDQVTGRMVGGKLMGWIAHKYDSARAHFLSSNIKKEDKEIICNMLDKLLATKIKRSRAVKYYDNMRLMVERNWLEGYHDVREEDLYRCLSEIEHNVSLGVWAKRDYKLALKLVLNELDNPLAAVIKPNKDRGKRQQFPQAFLTVHDVLRMVESDWKHLRDKAMIACLYESCCRPHEFFMLHRKDVRYDIVPAQLWDGNGGKVKVDIEVATLNISPEAKTGARPVPLIFTVPWLKAWMRQSGNTEHIWTKLRGANRNKHIEYWEARKALKQIASVAGIPPEKAHFYASRHGRSTEVSRYMTPSQQSQYAGWVQGSKMPRTYIHLSGKDVIAPLLSPFGITVESMQSERDVWLKIMKMGQEQLRKCGVQAKL